MALTASQLITSINKKIHGAKGKIGDDTQMYRILNEASRKLRGDVKLIGTKRTGAPILVAKDIYEYPAPSDIQFTKVIEMYDEQDVRLEIEATDPKHFFNLRNPVLTRQQSTEIVSFQNPLGNRGDGTYAVEFRNGSPYFLIRSYSTNRVSSVVNTNDSYNGNGTWVASDDATNVRTDNQRYKEGAGSVAFDSSGGAVNVTITNSTMTAVDLTDLVSKGKAYVSLYIPSTVPASVTLRWGNDASNYYQKQVTTCNNGLALVPGWNVLGFDWESATETGSVTDTLIDYVQLKITNSSAVAITGYRLDAIRFSLGREITPKYYSRFIVTDETSSARKAEFETGGDTSVLYEDEDDLLITKATIIALKELREFKEAENLEVELTQNIENYKARNPEQQEPKSYSYYLT